MRERRNGGKNIYTLSCVELYGVLELKGCLICGKDLTDRILTLDNMPKKAQHMPAEKDLATERGMRLDLFQCAKCGLVQFDCGPVEYYRDVIRAGGVSEKMRKLRKEQYEHFIQLFGLEGKKIWEVGCGGGEFLNILGDLPVQTFGVEHDPKLADTARKKGLTVEEGFVDSAYRSVNGPFDAFLSFNFLEHQPHPNEMLRGIFENLTDDGVGIITVPSFEYFLETASYYEFIRDHLAYYTSETLSYLLIQNGFSVFEETRFNDDTLCVFVKKRKRIESDTLIGNRQEINDALLKCIEGFEKDTVAVWGASHQAFTILSTLGLGDKVSFIIDSAPFKTGFYSPASHVRIVPPDTLKTSNTECVIIMAPGYSDEICRQIISMRPNIRRIVSVIGRTVRILRDE